MPEEGVIEYEAIVLVGKKPTAVYLARTIMLLASIGVAIIKARGRFIPKAITVAVRALKASSCNCEVGIDEEAIKTDEQEFLVPKIEIKLVKEEQ